MGSLKLQLVLLNGPRFACYSHFRETPTKTEYFSKKMVILELLMTMEPHGERPNTRQARAGLPDRPDSLPNSGVHYWKLLSCLIFTHCEMLIFYELVNFPNSYHFTTLIYFGGRFNFNSAGELAVSPLCCKIRKKMAEKMSDELSEF